MVRKLDDADFRAWRMMLEPDDFAITDGEPDPAPTDLVDPNVWHGIMDIADDVAIRTTSYQGSRVGLLYELWGGWLEVMPEGSIVGYAMLDCADDFSASILSLLHGFYRQAVASLRSALEVMVFACDCQMRGDARRWETSERGEDMHFVHVRHRLRTTVAVEALEDKARTATGRTMFDDKNGTDPGGWVTALYGRLSSFAHARGDLSNARIWQSNGPIYSARGMKLSYHSYLETYALLLLLAKIAQPQLAMPKQAAVLFYYDSRRRYLGPPDRRLCGFLKTEVFG